LRFIPYPPRLRRRADRYPPRDEIRETACEEILAGEKKPRRLVSCEEGRAPTGNAGEVIGADRGPGGLVVDQSGYCYRNQVSFNR
jgi:hypothetical protein